MFYNNLCYQYFGEGCITNFTVDDAKAGCHAVLYQVYEKK